MVGLGYRTGFASWPETPELGNVGCEACHGAGKRHAEDPTKPYDKSSEGRCRECHNPDHSTGFDYKKHWPLVRHGMQKLRRVAKRE